MAVRKVSRENRVGVKGRPAKKSGTASKSLGNQAAQKGSLTRAGTIMKKGMPAKR